MHLYMHFFKFLIFYNYLTNSFYSIIPFNWFFLIEFNFADLHSGLQQSERRNILEGRCEKASGSRCGIDIMSLDGRLQTVSGGKWRRFPDAFEELQKL